MIIRQHDTRAGFFSCYTVLLYELIQFYNKTYTLPETLDTSNTFGMYKYDPKIDVTHDFFQHHETMKTTFEPKPVTNSFGIWGFQNYNYKNIQYNELIPFIKKYFSPSDKIINLQNILLSMYNIYLDNCIAIYYRGTDKKNETALDNFDSYYNKLIEIIADNTDMQIIVQTDSAQFLEFMKSKLVGKNLIVIKENEVSYRDKGIHHEKSPKENFKDIHYFFSTILILSRCKHVLCSSGNVSIAMMFYRVLYTNNIANIYQNYDMAWL